MSKKFLFLFLQVVLKNGRCLHSKGQGSRVLQLLLGASVILMRFFIHRLSMIILLLYLLVENIKKMCYPQSQHFRIFFFQINTCIIIDFTFTTKRAVKKCTKKHFSSLTLVCTASENY